MYPEDLKKKKKGRPAHHASDFSGFFCSQKLVTFKKLLLL